MIHRSKHGSRIVLFCVAGMLGLWAGGKNLAQAGEVIRVVGSTTVLPIVSRAAEAYMNLHGGEVQITVNAGGSGVGVNGAGTGQAQIGMVSREVTSEERDRFSRPGLKTFVVGRDAVACAISASVYEAGVRSLTREQIAKIYRGEIRNWKAVGGPDRAIVVIDKEHHRGTRHVFMNFVFGDENARAPGARLVTGANNEEQAKIGQSDSAIGMLSLAWLNGRVRGVAIELNGDRIEPTLQNIVTGRFPISRNLNLVTVGEPQGQVRKFIDFIQGPEGRKIVEGSGYIAP